MSVWQATKSFFGFSEEDISPLVPESTDISIAEVEKRPPVVRTIKGTLGGSKASNSFSSISEIRIEEPRVYEDSVIIAQSLRENKPVIVNLKYLEPKEGELLVNFACGSAYGLNGHMMKLGEGIFLFTPASVLITDADQKTNLERGMEQEERQEFF